MSDRDYVLSQAKNLKNHKIKTSQGDKQQYFVQQHYPMELQEMKKALMPYYRRAAQAGFQRAFRVVGTELVLFINKQLFRPGMKFPERRSNPNHIRFLSNSSSPSQASAEVAQDISANQVLNLAPPVNMNTQEDSVSDSESNTTIISPPEKRHRATSEVSTDAESPSLLKHDRSGSF